MKRIKLLIAYIRLKIHGYNKSDRYFYYAVHNLITFEQYGKYIDNKIMKGGKHNEKCRRK